MAERQVTVDGVTRELPDPFLLLATENPIEYEGTFPLPEAQLDRFFLRTALGYPERRRRAADPRRAALRAPARRPRSRSSVSTRCTSCAQPRSTSTSTTSCIDWIVELVRATRELDVGRRSAARCAAASRSSAPRARGRCSTAASYVVPEDVERLFVPVLVHRVVFTPALRRACPRRPAGRRRSRSSARRASSSRPARAPRRIRCSRAGSAADPRRSGRRAERAPDLPARPAPPRDRPLVRDDAEPPARTRHGRRRLASVPAGRRHATRSTGRRRRGCPPRAAADEFVVRERFAEEAPQRRDRLRPPARDGVLPAAAALARQARGDAHDRRARARERGRRAAASSATSTTRTASRTGGRRKGERKLIELRDERLWSSEFGGAAGLARALDRSSRRAPARGHPGHLRLRALGLPRRRRPTELWLAARRASLGHRAGRDPGPDLGAELSGRQRDRRPACATRGPVG